MCVVQELCAVMSANQTMEKMPSVKAALEVALQALCVAADSKPTLLHPRINDDACCNKQLDFSSDEDR